MTASPPGGAHLGGSESAGGTGLLPPERFGGEPGVVVYAFPFSVTPGKGSGVERYAFDLVSNLPAVPQPIRVVAPPAGRLERYLATFTSIPLRTWSMRPRVFHALSPYSARVLFALGRRPVITTVHDIIFREWSAESPTFFERRRRPYNELAIRRSDRIIVPFQYTKRRIQEAYGTPDERFRIVNYGTNLTPNYRAAVRRGPSDERPVDVLFLGGPNALARGGRVVLDVYERLLESDSGLRLMLSVSGWHGDLLRASARTRGLEPRVRWVGFVPEAELPSFLARSTVFLYPTQMGFSYLLMQAMASGAAVVTSTAFDIPEFAEGGAAVTLGLEDVDGYVQSIRRLLSSSHDRKALVARAGRRIEGLTPSAMATQTAAVYREF